jgi:two-component system sensor histidine kinase KdpD
MGEAARKQILAAISEQADRLDDLVRNLLAMTRVETSELTLHKLPGSVAEVVDAARRRVDRVLSGRPVSVTSERGIPLVEMDGQLLEQVFVNVLENAARHTPPGRAITVRIGSQGARVVTTVEDEGPGIAEDERERIFEKFYRGRGTRPDDGGLGLGLTICRASVTAHGGTIDLGNRAGGSGAVVTIALPASTVDLTSAGELLPDVP